MGAASQITLRQEGPAMVVGTAALREKLVRLLAASHIPVTEAEDPYAAMGELCRQRNPYAAVIFSLQSLYREELEIVAIIRRRFPQIEVWLTDLEGRSAALAEAMRLGATGLLDDEGLHQLQQVQPAATAAPPVVATPVIERPAPEAAAPHVSRNGSRAAEQVEAAPAATQTDVEERPVGRAQPNGPRRKRKGLASQAAPTPASKQDETTRAPHSPDEPVLTAEELRALLQDQPGLPPLQQE